MIASTPAVVCALASSFARFVRAILPAVFTPILTTILPAVFAPIFPAVGSSLGLSIFAALICGAAPTGRVVGPCNRRHPERQHCNREGAAQGCYACQR
jgi:hypothetical protein